MINSILETDESLFMEQVQNEQTELVLKHPLIYKYNSLDAGLRILKDRTIAFRNPLFLNDPFDCSLDLLDFSKIPVSYRRKLLDKYFGHLDRSAKRQMLAHFNKKSDAYMAEYVKKGMRSDLAQRGITCFSAVFDQMLMWSHYGDSHTGICIGFDLPALYTSVHHNSHPERLLIKVRYAKDFVSMDYYKHPSESVINWLRTKSADWSYEQELRFVLYGLNFNDRGLHIQPVVKNCIKEVYIGAKISAEQESKVKLALQDYPDVPILKMTRAPGRFQLMAMKHQL